MKIELKKNGTVYSNGQEAFLLFIDNIQADTFDYLLERGRYHPDGCSDESVLTKFLLENCIILPDKLEIRSDISSNLSELDYGMADTIAILRKQDEFIITISVWYTEQMLADSYLNPYKLLEHATTIGADLGFTKCSNSNFIHEYIGANFVYTSAATGIIGERIMEAKKLLNMVLQKAAKEMHDAIGRQLTAE